MAGGSAVERRVHVAITSLISRNLSKIDTPSKGHIMKLAFGKSKVSREEIEQDAAREIEALIASGEDRPAIDWSVYGLPAEVADPAVASADLGAPAKPRTRAVTAQAKKPRAPRKKKTPA